MHSCVHVSVDSLREQGGEPECDGRGVHSSVNVCVHWQRAGSVCGEHCRHNIRVSTCPAAKVSGTRGLPHTRVVREGAVQVCHQLLVGEARHGSRPRAPAYYVLRRQRGQTQILAPTPQSREQTAPGADPQGAVWVEGLRILQFPREGLRARRKRAGAPTAAARHRLSLEVACSIRALSSPTPMPRPVLDAIGHKAEYDGSWPLWSRVPDAGADHLEGDRVKRGWGTESRERGGVWEDQLKVVAA